MRIPIIYEDEWLLIVNKPPGLLTIPTPKKEKRTLTNILNLDLRQKDLAYRLHPCHRLDRETSGLIIYAKGKAIQKKMMDMFKKKKIKKTYVAFIQGIPKREQGLIKSLLDGSSAITEYKVIEKRKNFSIVEVTPRTGRKNQIRIHFKRIGHPLVGESRFAFRKDYLLKAKRVCLHAQSLEFIHPITKKFMNLISELAGDLQEFLKQHLN